MTSLILPGLPAPDSRPALNLARFHKQYVHGDITVFITWLAPEMEECMVLVPTFKVGLTQEFAPCVITLSQVGLYSDGLDSGTEAEVEALVTAFAWCLGMDSGPATLLRILGIIRNHMGDLVACPPRPRENEEVRADAILTDRSTGKTREMEVRDDV